MSKTVTSRFGCRLVALLLLLVVAERASAQLHWSMKSLYFVEATSGITNSAFGGDYSEFGVVNEAPWISSTVNFGPSSYRPPGVYLESVRVNLCDATLICGWVPPSFDHFPMKTMPMAWDLGLARTKIRNDTVDTWSSFTIQLVDFGPDRTLFSNAAALAASSSPFTHVATYVDNDHLFRGLHYSVVNFTYGGGLLAPGQEVSFAGMAAVAEIIQRERDSFWLRFWAVPTTQGPNAAPPLPVPEPETYAMLLAGLGLLGLTARRRRQKPGA